MKNAKFPAPSLLPCLCTGLFFAIALISPLPASSPNIVFILADDLGITDISAYARHFNKAAPGELFFETPHLDKLVADGVAFSQSYANQLCTPTRAAILTGRIASRMGVTTATPNTKTYFKWRGLWDGKKPHFPTQPGKFRVGKAGEPTGEDYLTNDEKIRAVQYIKSRVGNEKPFLLYHAPFAVHTPFQAPQPDVKRFSAKKQSGHLGRDNATYASMLKHLDDAIGAIRATLVETGLAENTVLIFTSDNGGVTYTEPAATTNLPFKGGKATLTKAACASRPSYGNPAALMAARGPTRS